MRATIHVIILGLDRSKGLFQRSSSKAAEKISFAQYLSLKSKPNNLRQESERIDYFVPILGPSEHTAGNILGE